VVFRFGHECISACHVRSGKSFPDAGAPADTARRRTAQIKRLTGRFEGRLNLWEGGVAVIRVIPRPIYEYNDPVTELPHGAIFGLTATGTNPDVLLLVEAHEDSDGALRWEYAFAQMTSAGLDLRLDDETVVRTARVPLAEKVFATWTYYFLPREIEVPAD
jgi:hypothetical protein